MLTFMYKKIIHNLEPEISKLLIMSIKEGTFHNCLNIGCLLHNFRPIATIPVLKNFGTRELFASNKYLTD